MEQICSVLPFPCECVSQATAGTKKMHDHTERQDNVSDNSSGVNKIHYFSLSCMIFK